MVLRMRRAEPKTNCRLQKPDERTLRMFAFTFLKISHTTMADRTNKRDRFVPQTYGVYPDDSQWFAIDFLHIFSGIKKPG